MDSILKTLAPKAFVLTALAGAFVLWAAGARAGFITESIDNDIPGEVAAAAEDGKRLVIMFQQTGCPYCAKMRVRVFPDPKVVEFYSKYFVLIYSNIRGDLPVVAPDGKEMTEKELAYKLRVRATPVLMYFNKNGSEALKVTGFLDAERFNKAGQFVLDGVNKTATTFFRYLQTN